MNLTTQNTVQDIAVLLDAPFTGDGSQAVRGINEIHRVRAGDLTFVDHPKYYLKALRSEATVILINKKMEPPDGKALIFSDDPFRDYNYLANHYRPFRPGEQMISPDARIGKHTTLQPSVFIGHDVRIGDNCIIHPHVSIYDHCVIGDNVIIQSNTVIGSDAFYYKTDKVGRHEKWHSCGRVVIKNNVEIGANCTIDRGVSSETRIGEGTKLDNLVHIGHDVVVGRNCIFAAQVGIAGVVTIEDEVKLWGQVGVATDLTIGKGAVVLAQSGISKSLDGGKIYFGSPAGEVREKWKELASLRQLPELLKQLRSKGKS